MSESKQRQYHSPELKAKVGLEADTRHGFDGFDRIIADRGRGDAVDAALAHLDLECHGREPELGREQLGIDGDLAVYDGDR